ncbi:hypothetical protein [Streptomyces rugosispiralis]|uniref:Uncharacterized protein n=1 Tax=Streptomyces rugosispiralis TaxID=2967341 RepID=A0ABT1VDK1_9ACTN|nr:hypothetical protein [Streptomyces rugosispiralis]MCQ8195491.1 hypothetical protein [Streptomyces rugosispiralis]
MDVIVMAEGDTSVGLARERRYRELVEEVLRPYLMAFTSRTDNWSDEKRPSAALANADTVHHAPAARAAREVWHG